MDPFWSAPNIHLWWFGRWVPAPLGAKATNQKVQWCLYFGLFFGGLPLQSQPPKPRPRLALAGAIQIPAVARATWSRRRHTSAQPCGWRCTSSSRPSTGACWRPACGISRFRAVFLVALGARAFHLFKGFRIFNWRPNMRIWTYCFISLLYPISASVRKKWKV